MKTMGTNQNKNTETKLQTIGFVERMQCLGSRTVVLSKLFMGVCCLFQCAFQNYLWVFAACSNAPFRTIYGCLLLVPMRPLFFKHRERLFLWVYKISLAFCPRITGKEKGHDESSKGVGNTSRKGSTGLTFFLC
jgi:hypothetical protein